MATKIHTIQNAYSQMRISGLTVNPTPEDVETALCRLEDMMAEYDLIGLCVGYNFEQEPDPNSLTNVKRGYWQMMATNLAIILLTDFNKVVPQSLMGTAKASYSAASSAVASDRARQVQYPNRQPIGSGNQRYGTRQRKYYRQQPLPPNECATNEMLVGDINDFEESYSAYLNDGEVIESFSLEADSGLTIQSSANNTPVISYRIKATNSTTSGIWLVVKITVTTDAGRVEIREINFQVTLPDIRN